MEQGINIERQRERIKRGAQYLDSVYPNWANVIDLVTFDFNKSQYCVLGQTLGWTRATHDRLSADFPDQYDILAEFGFDLPMDDDITSDEMGELWLEAINSRRQS